MDPEIHFGEVEHTQTSTRLRPDCNGQFAVVSLYSPSVSDLPIYVDLDVMRDMLHHATSDRRVELGGVLLGGQFADDQGKPFVVITDCLRARHYESTKGSFKFTHDTWEQITREREQLPTDLQMVGWYHTHPDWGVFLSGLDMFICDNFFNKPLDVALVIDPCQVDTGFFQWTSDSQQRIRRTGGFWVFASRFRDEELRDFATELEGQVMPDSTRSMNSPVSVHIPPAPASAAWQSLAVLGMLGMQFLVMLMLAIRLIPAAPSDTAPTRELAALKQSVDRLDQARQREADIDAKLQVLEMVVRREGNVPEGLMKSLADRTGEVEQLRGSLRGQQSLSKEQETKIISLENSLSQMKDDQEQNRTQISKLRTQIEELNSDLRTARQGAPDADNAAVAADTKQPEKMSWWSAWWADGKSVGFGALLGAAVVGITVFAVQRRKAVLDLATEPHKVAHPSTANE